MTFGQLRERNMNIFLEKPCTKCNGKDSSRSFCKNSELSIFPDQLSEVL